MKIAEIMTRDVQMVTPEDTLQDAARMMADIDCGVLPVAKDDRLVGMLTDRDIVVRGVAAGMAPGTTQVREVMSGEIKYVFEDESVDDLARNISTLQIRRLPVMSRDKRLVGIVSLGDLATTRGQDKQSSKAIAGVSKPNGGSAQAVKH